MQRLFYVPLRILRGLLMNRSDNRFLNRSHLTALVLITGCVLGMLAACSSDGGNSVPSGPPPISTAGGGATGEAGEDSGGSSTTGGSTSHAGSSNGGTGGRSTPIGEGGEAGADVVGQGGEAGEGPGPVVRVCPTTELGFLNAPSPATVLKSTFDNARLGSHPQGLPALN